MKHPCHAAGCSKEVPPRMLMCLKHWRMVPKKLQITIWNEYRPGQENDKHPSLPYLVAQRGAVAVVAEKEGRLEEARAAKDEAVRFWRLCEVRGLTFKTPSNPRGLAPNFSMAFYGKMGDGSTVYSRTQPEVEELTRSMERKKEELKLDPNYKVVYEDADSFYPVRIDMPESEKT